MADQVVRNKFKMVNKFQQRIIFFSMVPTIFVCVFMIAFVAFFVDQLMMMLVNGSLAIESNTLMKFAGIFIGGVLGFFILMLIKLYYFSKRLVGWYDRIIRELDLTIAGERSGNLHVRQYDDFAKPLIDRINILIKGYSPPTN